MKISIAGKDMPPCLVSVDDHRFGDAATGPAILPYALTIAPDGVLRDFRKYYDDYIADVAALPPEDNETIARTLESLQFPPFPELLEHEPTVTAGFLAHVAYDFLNAIFTGRTGLRPRYFVRTVDHVAVRPDGVTLTGSVLDHRRDLLDQIAAKMPEGTPVPRGEEPGFMSNYDIPDED